jgi:hypothetical protein
MNQPQAAPVVNVTMPAINLTAQMPEQGAQPITINIPEQAAPIVNVKSEPIVTVVKADKIDKKRKINFTTDENGKITGAESNG